MSAKNGAIGWVDLTVTDATAVRDFYRHVTGATTSDVPMGDYSDYCLLPAEGGEPFAGVCHARGANTGIPPIWLVYFQVADLTNSVAECIARGGSVVREPVAIGRYGFMAVIRDPAGAICALVGPVSVA
ncbi:MAG: VOC family protein [Gemmataceae bacterium]|nr:VOC family protein [Gemmataceae bacterium]